MRRWQSPRIAVHQAANMGALRWHTSPPGGGDSRGSRGAGRQVFLCSSVNASSDRRREKALASSVAASAPFTVTAFLANQLLAQREQRCPSNGEEHGKCHCYITHRLRYIVPLFLCLIRVTEQSSTGSGERAYSQLRLLLQLTFRLRLPT